MKDIEITELNAVTMPKDEIDLGGTFCGIHCDMGYLCGITCTGGAWCGWGCK